MWDCQLYMTCVFGATEVLPGKNKFQRPFCGGKIQILFTQRKKEITAAFLRQGKKFKAIPGKKIQMAPFEKKLKRLH